MVMIKTMIDLTFLEQRDDVPVTRPGNTTHNSRRDSKTHCRSYEQISDTFSGTSNRRASGIGPVPYRSAADVFLPKSFPQAGLNKG